MEMEQQLKEVKKLLASKEQKTSTFTTRPRKRTAHQSSNELINLSLATRLLSLVSVATQLEPTKMKQNVGMVSSDEACDTEHYTGLRIKYLLKF